MYDIEHIDNIDTGSQSITAHVCEQAKLYGATPERDEFDPRKTWERETATGAVTEAFSILADGIGMTGFQMADESGSLLWGFVNTLDAQIRRLERNIDRISPELRDLQKEQDGTEIKSRELELLTDRARNPGARRDAFEEMRDAAAAQYLAQTGEMWGPRTGPHTSRSGLLTSASIDAHDFMRARENQKTKENLPDGTLIATAGGKDGEPIRPLLCNLFGSKEIADEYAAAPVGMTESDTRGACKQTRIPRPVGSLTIRKPAAP